MSVDVREPLDAQAPAFDAPEVVNLPLGQLPQRWPVLPQDRERVLVCQNGDKSAQASGFVRTKGDVHVSPMCTGYAKEIGTWACDEAEEQRERAMQAWG